MAQGDVKSGVFQIVGNGNSGDIRPPVGEEWVIHNIFYAYSLDFIIGSPTVRFTFDSDTVQGARMGLSIHLTNSYYITIKNTQNLTNNIAFDGVQTK